MARLQSININLKDVFVFVKICALAAFESNEIFYVNYKRSMSKNHQGNVSIQQIHSFVYE